MKLTTITSVIEAQTVNYRGTKDIEIEYLLTDSRELKQDKASQTLFFALKTDKRDGASFIEQLAERGVRAFVINADSEYVKTLAPLNITLLVVPDSLTALQTLAAYKRSLYPDIPVIGITGSNGKTVVKEWLYWLLKDDYNITRSPKSYNSQIGVPLSVWMLNDKTELAIFEAGISQRGEMQRLEKIIQPTIGVITFIGKEHGENFSSIDEKRQEKMLLFSRSRVVIEDSSHQNVRTCAAVMRYLGYDEDEISKRLLQKTHETVLEINLSALTENVRYYKSLLKPSTQLVSMVKALAYGTGSIEVSRCLQQAGADYLAVAVCDEAVDLRKAGITMPIIIMDPEVTALKKILENNLEPNIYSFQSLNNIITAVQEEGLEDYPIHIKIDSGMHRLGFEKEDIQRLTDLLNKQRAVRVKSVFSHLAGADEECFDDFTHQQINYFAACADELQQALRYPIMRHILNSAGIERFPEYQFDMVRLGIGHYGFGVLPSSPLRPVCTLKTTILQVKKVKRGESIGYSRRTILDRDTEVAVIPIGYADGFDRRLGNGVGAVLVRQQRCKVLGNVCMDLCMIDVTGVNAQVGDEVVLFGDKLPLEEIAHKLGTITYELLTSVSTRVKRVYYYEG